jgi:uncharacterized protein (DUF433 family)
MILDSAMVSTTELAYIAGVSDREVNRLVDEQILPDFLFKTDNGRRFDPSVAVLARFYFEAGDILTAPARKSVIQEMAGRIKDSPDAVFIGSRPVAVFECKTTSGPSASRPVWCNINLHVDWRFTKIDMEPFFMEVCERATDAARASEKIVSDPEILGGEPVFAGSRVPIDTVIGSVDEGMGLEELQDSWSFLTEELIADARLYARLHPRRGRPRRPSGEADGWKLQSMKVIPPEAGNA